VLGWGATSSRRCSQMLIQLVEIFGGRRNVASPNRRSAESLFLHSRNQRIDCRIVAVARVAWFAGHVLRAYRSHGSRPKTMASVELGRKKAARCAKSASSEPVRCVWLLESLVTLDVRALHEGRIARERGCAAASCEGGSLRRRSPARRVIRAAPTRCRALPVVGYAAASRRPQRCHNRVHDTPYYRDTIAVHCHLPSRGLLSVSAFAHGSVNGLVRIR
jgi:hypothetical protein